MDASFLLSFFGIAASNVPFVQSSSEGVRRSPKEFEGVQRKKRALSPSVKPFLCTVFPTECRRVQCSFGLLGTSFAIGRQVIAIVRLEIVLRPPSDWVRATQVLCKSKICTKVVAIARLGMGRYKLVYRKSKEALVERRT